MQTVFNLFFTFYKYKKHKKIGIRHKIKPSEDAEALDIISILEQDEKEDFRTNVIDDSEPALSLGTQCLYMNGLFNL